MKDFPTARFVERRSVVAIVPEPQRDEPPGASHSRDREVVIVAYEDNILPMDVQATVAAAGKGRPRQSTGQPFASKGGPE